LHRRRSNLECANSVADAARTARSSGRRQAAAAGQAIGSEAGDAGGIAEAVSVGPKATRRPVVR
jgi:pyruvoyl-dependent arginine decarboxylase (PvlArgDC)